LIIGDFSLSVEQAKAQMAMWSILAAPLLMSNDLRTISPEFREILLNKEVIKINQDPKGQMGKRVLQTKSHMEVWTRELSSNSLAAVIFSRSQSMPAIFETTLETLKFSAPKGYDLFDITDNKPLGHFFLNETLAIKVNPNGAVMFKATPTT
ncbi:alpha-N-acetylgalactosaminidase-like, partial [Anneissia japonica]|uniref:alpha-N-acetylgalactosaminidase-like n=1 Tax=Anneissia japonica TaxID=1529436 RepID=UPI001425A3B4